MPSLSHGLSESSEYVIWSMMKQRCYNPKSPSWKWYGERGIKICKRWMDSFSAFVADVGPRPSLQHSLDRYPKGDGDYEPGNVRWATDQEQADNRRSRLIDLTGKRFGAFIVLERASNTSRVRWMCFCNCGVASVFLACHIVKGKIQCQSCKAKGAPCQ